MNKTSKVISSIRDVEEAIVILGRKLTEMESITEEEKDYFLESCFIASASMSVLRNGIEKIEDKTCEN